eukprot:353017-Chlamydomonas_euryale.AAC.11
MQRTLKSLRRTMCKLLRVEECQPRTTAFCFNPACSATRYLVRAPPPHPRLVFLLPLPHPRQVFLLPLLTHVKCSCSPSSPMSSAPPPTSHPRQCIPPSAPATLPLRMDEYGQHTLLALVHWLIGRNIFPISAARTQSWQRARLANFRPASLGWYSPTHHKLERIAQQ